MEAKQRIDQQPTTRTSDGGQILHRRAVAFLIELMVFEAVVFPPLWIAVGDTMSGPAFEDVPLMGDVQVNLATPIAHAAFYLGRDLFGGTSPAKRLLGLRVRSAVGLEPSQLQRLLRNVTLLLTPLWWLVEYGFASDGPHSRRLGDRIAKTEVVDENPALARKPWGLAFVAALIGIVIVRTKLNPAVHAFLLDALY